MRPVIIALAGRAGSGKSSIADYLKSNYKAEIVSFATPLKRVVKEIFEFSDDQIYGDLKDIIDPNCGFTPRATMERTGDALRRHFGKDIHVERALKIIREQPEKIWVIDDCRHLNEASAIAKVGFVWRLHCSDYRSGSTHISETSPDEIPPENVFRELYGSRALGLIPLIMLADEAWEATRKKAGW